MQIVRCSLKLSNLSSQLNQSDPSKQSNQTSELPGLNRCRCLPLFHTSSSVLAACLLWAAQARACGPDFPNNLLDQGDKAVLIAPEANFAAELKRMNLVASKFKAVQTEGGNYASAAADTEMSDLTAALKKSKVTQEEAERIRTAHAAARDAL